MSPVHRVANPLGAQTGSLCSHVCARWFVAFLLMAAPYARFGNVVRFARVRRDHNGIAIWRLVQVGSALQPTPLYPPAEQAALFCHEQRIRESLPNALTQPDAQLPSLR